MGSGRKGTCASLDLACEYARWLGIDFDLHNGTSVSLKFVRKEYSFGEDIVKKLFNGYTVHKQYPVFDGKYRLDWYVPELNIAIEFDENHHDYKTEEDSTRQKEIEKELGCSFLRYKD